MTAFYWGVRLRIILLRIAHLFAARVFVPRGLRKIAIFGFRQLFSIASRRQRTQLSQPWLRSSHFLALSYRRVFPCQTC